MTTLEFLQFILPVGGYYAKMALVPGGPPKQTFYNTVDDLAAGIEFDAKRGDKNLYFAVSSFLTKMSRKQDNVQATKALFIDIDCGQGKPYGTKRDGMMALATFVKDNEMPMPTIVDSGNGIHVYWVFTEEMTPADWKPLADAFKRSLQSNRFQVDWAVPADSARVLRPIGTTNLKGGRSVKLLKKGEPTDYAFFQKKFLGTPAAPVAPTTAASFEGVAIPAHILARGPAKTTLIQAPDYAPAHPGVVAEKCDQIAWGVAHQDKVEEPFWHAMLGVAAYCLDPEETAKEWSNKHPNYSEVQTLAKMHRWKASTTGPTTCAKFKDLRSAGCNSCKFKDKINTPASIGVVRDAVELSADAPDKVAREVPLPEKFKRIKKNGVTAFSLVLENTDIDVCKFDIYPMSYGRDESLGYEVVRYRWKRPHVGWSDLVMRQAFLNPGAAKEFSTALADQGIVMGSVKTLELFQMLLRAYMDELRNLQSLTNLYGNMGWKENNTAFLWGTTMFTRMEDGEIVETNMNMSNTVQNSAQEMYGTSGTLQKCIDATAVLESQQLYVHQFMIGVSLSSVLYRFTGIDGLIVHIYGVTGAGKSLAQYWMQSMWGNPKLLHFSAQFTQNSLYSRLGFHCNLPMTIDETTRMSPEAANDLTLMVSQGRDKYRLDKNSQERAPKTWGTTIGTSGNIPMTSILSSAGAENEAQLMRVVDIPIEKHKMFDGGTRPGERLYEEVSTNYGWIGPLVLKHWMSMGEQALREAIRKHKNRFASKYGVKFAGAERFWETCLVLSDFAMETAVQLGLLLFDHENATKYVIRNMDNLRINVVEARVDEFDMLARYLNEHVRETVTVMHTGVNMGVVDNNFQPNSALHVRHEVHRTANGGPFTRGSMFIDKRHFREWLVKNGGDIKAMINKFRTENIEIAVPNNKAVLGRNTRVRSPQLVVIGVNLDHPRLKGILDEADTAATNTQLQSHLQLVQP